MSKPKETPAHVQVAEAGFGDAVEAKGFKRVGKTHWRLDGDGIVHHIRLNPGSPHPVEWLSDVAGYEITGLTRLAEKHGFDLHRQVLPGSSLECDMVIPDWIIEADQYHQRADYDEKYKRFESEPFWKKFYWSVFDPDKLPPDFRKRHYVPPRGVEWTTPSGHDVYPGAWVLSRLTPEELAESMAETWAETCWPRIHSSLSFQAIYQNEQKEWISRRNTYYPPDVLMAYLAKDLLEIHRVAELIVSRLGPTVDDVRQAIWRKAGRRINGENWRRIRNTKAGKSAIRDAAIRHVASNWIAVRDMKDLTLKLGLDLGFPDIDHDAINRWELRIRERAAGIDYLPGLSISPPAEPMPNEGVIPLRPPEHMPSQEPPSQRPQA